MLYMFCRETEFAAIKSVYKAQMRNKTYQGLKAPERCHSSVEKMKMGLAYTWMLGGK